MSFRSKRGLLVLVSVSGGFYGIFFLIIFISQVGLTTPTTSSSNKVRKSQRESSRSLINAVQMNWKEKLLAKAYLMTSFYLE